MAISSSLGSLTLDLIANTGGFTGPLDQAARITKKQMKEMGMAVDEFGNYTDKAMKQAAQATQQLDAQFKKMAQNVDRELALYGETSRVAKARYDLENTELVKLDAVKKAAYLEDMRRLDAMDAAKAAFSEQAAKVQQLAATHEQLATSMQREIVLYGETSRAAKMRYEMEQGSLMNLDKYQQYTLLRRAKTLDAMDAEAAKSKQLAAATKQLEAQSDQLNESMLAQLATYGQVSRASQLRYRMEHGDLKSLDAARKASNLQLAQQLDNLDKAAMGSMRGLRGVATGIGYQMQDIAVQFQMGTNPMMIFAQQGSQIASLFGPAGAVVGAVIAVGGAIAGGLLPSLFKTGDATEEVADKVSGLVAEMDRFNEVQKEIIRRAQEYQVSDQQKKYDDLTKSIEAQRKEIERLNEENGKMQFVSTGGGGTLSGAGLGTLVEIDNTEKLAKATRGLSDAETAQLAIKKEIEDLRDPAKSRELLGNLAKEIELIGLSGKELYLKEAAQKSLVGWQAQEYVQLKLTGDQRKANAKAEEDADKARDDAAKKAAEEEKSRADSIAKTIAGMEREIALYGVTSKAAQTEYDILNGILKVKGGLEGVEGRRLVQLAKIQDAVDAEKESQDEYVAKLKDWVKGENDKVAAKDKIIQALKDEEAQLGMTADAYLEMNLRAKGASDDEVKEALERARRIRAKKEELKIAEDAVKSTEEMFKRLDEIGANIWTDLLDGTTNAFDAIKDMFKAMLADMAHQAVTKPIMLNIQQTMSGSSSTNATQGASAIGAGGIWAAVAVAVVAGVGAYNKEQEEQFAKMTAEYRQGSQSTGTLLGMANAKSDSLNKSIQELEKYADDSLGVNRGMLQALIDIRSGIAGVAAGFSRTLTGTGVTGIKTGNSAMVDSRLVSGESGLAELYSRRDDFSLLAKMGIDDPITDFVTNFLGTLGNKVTSEIFKESKKIIDSGIAIKAGQTLADIMAQGTIEAFAYADIQTKKKVFGLTTSNKVKTQTEELDSVLLGQFADVFAGAGDALSQAAEIFGLEFDDYIDKLTVDAQKLSLKGLEGDALIAEIEAFFSSTLDNWAEIIAEGLDPASGQSAGKKLISMLTGQGGDALEKFQRVGEGAFETVIRLAGELNAFNEYADLLNLNFTAVGFAAVEASQAVAEAAGGFDKLAASLGSYYQNFFTEEERAAKQMQSLSDALADLGVDKVPETREAFRGMIEALVNETGLLTEESQKQFAALIGLSGVFAELVPATEALAEASRSAADIASERLGLENQLLQLQGNTEELRRRERAALDSSNHGLYDQIKALEDLNEANQAAATIANERLGLEGKLLQLQGNTEELRRREKEALDSSNHALYDQIKALEALNATAGERLGLEGQMLQLQGDTEELRRRERAALDESNRSLYDQIKALEDLNVANQIAAGIANERLGLEDKLLQLQGNTVELRRRELEALDPSNHALQQLIWSLQDAAAAAELAARANEEMIASLKESAGAAMDMVSKSIAAERARIEGIVGRATEAKAALDDAIGREKDMLSQSHDAKIKAMEDMASAEQAALEEASRLQAEAARNQISAVSDTIKNLSSLFESLSSAAYDMAIESDELTRTRRRAAEFEIETALRNAKAGRGLPNADDIQGALSTLQSNPAELYASFEEMAYATAVTQNRILELAGMAGSQLSIEQQRLAALQAQVEAAEVTVDMAGKYDAQIAEERARYESQVSDLDAQQELARKQLDKLTGIDTSVPTLAEAIAAYNESLLAADFDNAKEQLLALDEMEATAQAQLDALLGVESGVLSVQDSLNAFGEAVKIANERIAASGMESAVASTAKTTTMLLSEVTAAREESRELNNVIRQNTQDTADILRQMQEEALAL